MKGNYQEEQPLIKISPEMNGVFSGIYEVQQYTEVPVEVAEVEGQFDFLPVHVIDNREA